MDDHQTAKNKAFAKQYGAQDAHDLTDAAHMLAPVSTFPTSRPTLQQLAKEVLGIQQCGCATTVAICGSRIMTHLYMNLSEKFGKDLPDRISKVQAAVNRHPVAVMLVAKLIVLTYGRSFFDMGTEAYARTECEKLVRGDHLT